MEYLHADAEHDARSGRDAGFKVAHGALQQITPAMDTEWHKPKNDLKQIT